MTTSCPSLSWIVYWKFEYKQVTSVSAVTWVANLCAFVLWKTPADVCGTSQLSLRVCSSLQGEVVDVQYGSMEDLRKVRDTLNLTNQIAVLKLGQAPLLYTVRLLLCSWDKPWWVQWDLRRGLKGGEKSRKAHWLIRRGREISIKCLQ